jgi:hypothetical protein
VFGEETDQAPAGALVALLRFRRSAVEENEIDVGGYVQLPAAQLAHADHQQLFISQGSLDRNFREIGHRRAHLLEARRAGKVARHHAEQYAPAKLTQPAPELVIARGAERVEHFGARERRRIGELGGELGPRGERLPGVPRKADFPNEIRHLPFRMTTWTSIPS